MPLAIQPRRVPTLPATPPTTARTTRATAPARPVAALRAAAPARTAPRPGLFTRFAAAMRGFFAGALRAVGNLVQAPINALLLVGGKLLSAVQSLLGAEPAGRRPSASETGELRKVFGDSVDFGQVRIKEGNAGLLTVSGRAFTLGNTIYVPKGSLPLTRETLVHEMTHVWQYQHSGSAYLSKAIWAQWFGDAYLWRLGLDQGKSWAQLDPEQQAQLVSDAYAAGSFGGSVRPGGGDSYAGAIEAAIAELRAGRGAP